MSFPGPRTCSRNRDTGRSRPACGRLVRTPPRGSAGRVVGGLIVVSRLGSVEPEVSPELIATVRKLGRPLASPADLDPLLERIGAARFVLLGEASHGTHEFYT